MGERRPWHSAPSWTHVELCNFGCLLGCYKSTNSTDVFVTTSLRKKNDIVLLRCPLCLFFVSLNSSQQQCCVISTRVATHNSQSNKGGVHLTFPTCNWNVNVIPSSEFQLPKKTEHAISPGVFFFVLFFFAPPCVKLPVSPK